MNYIISEENVKALLSYLMTRPFQEVEGGVEMLRGLEKEVTEK